MPGNPTVIDADGHWNLRPGQIRTFLDPAYLPALEAREARQRAKLSDLPQGGMGKEDRAGSYDVAARLPDMDLEGIDQAVLFGGGFGEEWAGLDPGFAAALCRAWNDAAAAYAAGAPDRLKAVAKVPLIDVDLAVKELYRAVKELGFVGFVATQHVRDRNLDDPYFDPLWAAAQELDVPVCVHGGGQALDQAPIGIDRFKTRLMVHAFTHPVGQMTAVMCLLVGGVLERFPRLRAAFLEAGCGWAPWWLERLDEHYELMPSQAPALKAKPSEYALSGRCFFSCDPDEQMLGAVIDKLGEDIIVYASDYYHWDCKFPDTVRLIEERTDLSASAKRKLFEDNPRRLYRL